MFPEVYRNSRWRPLVFLDLLVFFCPVPVVIVVVRLSVFLRLISLFALRVFRASLHFAVLKGYLFRLKK